MKIFVQITSYRDSELVSTIKDCTKKAKNPNNLNFGVCWQRDEQEKDLKEVLDGIELKVSEFPWQQSKGAGWARSIAQSLYQGEDYVLQIDSHHRFERNWDESLVDMIKLLDSNKPIISSFAGAYRSSNGEKLSSEPYGILIAGFNQEGLPTLRPQYIQGWEGLNSPVKARFACGHYLFAKGSFCDDYKHDPNLYFEGLDVSLSARCFTMGYDLFHPVKSLLWHEYTRSNRPKHWLDHTEESKESGTTENSWVELDSVSKKRVRQLLGVENSNIELGEFGLGQSRTLREYEIYTGIEFSKKVVHESAAKGKHPPSFSKEEEWNKGIKGQVAPLVPKEHSLEISWDPNEIEKADDYVFWFFGFHDENGKEIYRNDLSKERHKEILEFKKTSIEVNFKSVKEPKTCIIWPFSKSRGWLKRVETAI